MNWHDLFTYHDGALFWKHRADMRREWNTRFAEKRAGVANALGYWCIRAGGKLHASHRIVWEMHHGSIPPGMQIDHVDGDRANNRIENLRLADYTQNRANCRRYKNNVVGYKGVHFHKPTQRYRAQICVRGRVTHIGLFDTPEEAHAAYCAAAEHHFGDFARTA